MKTRQELDSLWWQQLWPRRELSLTVERTLELLSRGKKVVTGLEGVPRACYILLGLTYALNLHYPRNVKYSLRYFRNLSWSWMLQSCQTESSHSGLNCWLKIRWFYLFCGSMLPNKDLTYLNILCLEREKCPPKSNCIVYFKLFVPKKKHKKWLYSADLNLYALESNCG